MKELKLKLTKTGNSNTVIIPAYILKYLGKKTGDYINVEIKEGK